MDIEDITTAINDAMRQIFIASLDLWQTEQQFNYQNYGIYPYRDRKRSVIIKADFDNMAFDINGLFAEESSYTRIYPDIVIPKIESVLVAVREYTVISLDFDGNEVDRFTSVIQEYQLQETTEYIEVEDVEVQTIRYLFPFNSVQNVNNLVLSLR